ncbi:MAG TPA: response regulator [bacterium]|nr:response regulator [bacterium]
MAYNILVVDDSAIIRKMVTRTIHMAHLPVGDIYQAENGRDALGILGANWIDLVLADINMPVMDGMAMLESMHNDEVMKNVPVIIVSTEGSETKIEKLWQTGMKAFVKKPFMPETIREVIQNVLGEWEDDEAEADTSADSF